MSLSVPEFESPKKLKGPEFEQNYTIHSCQLKIVELLPPKLDRKQAPKNRISSSVNTPLNYLSLRGKQIFRNKNVTSAHYQSFEFMRVAVKKLSRIKETNSNSFAQIQPKTRWTRLTACENTKRPDLMCLEASKLTASRVKFKLVSL